MVALLPSLVAPLLLVANVAGNLVTGRQALTGKQCGFLMCVSGTMNGTNIDYVLSSHGKRPLGWMAMGFGRAMANTPMVIMWAHEGKVTLSQRHAPREVMPTVDPNPPRIATVVDSLTSLTGDSSSFGFTVPADENSKKHLIIFAYGTEPPGSSDVDAHLQQHYEFRTALLDLTGQSSTPTPSASSDSISTPTKQPSSEHAITPSNDIPLLSYQRSIIAHAIFCVAGFLVFLPSGALLARYLRTSTSKWFTGHWCVQFVLAGPTIVIGIAMGIRSVSKAGAMHLNDTHKKLGTAIFALYALQLMAGALIHCVKPRNSTRRPLQNYIHVFLGLLIIVLAMYQTHIGFDVEWAKTTGRAPFSRGVYILFYLWTLLLAFVYFGGLALLPKQFRQEGKPEQIPNDNLNQDEYLDRD